MGVYFCLGLHFSQTNDTAARWKLLLFIVTTISAATLSVLLALIGHAEQCVFILIFKSFCSPHLTLFVTPNKEGQGGRAERRGRARRYW